MSRRQHDDHAPPARTFPLSIVLAAGGIGMFLGLLLGVGIGYFAAGKAGPAAGGGRPMTRDQVRAAVVGKTPQQVINALGRPARTTNGDKPNSRWTYYNASVDPVSGKVDPSLEIQFGDDDPPTATSAIF